MSPFSSSCTKNTRAFVIKYHTAACRLCQPLLHQNPSIIISSSQQRHNHTESKARNISTVEEEAVHQDENSLREMDPGLYPSASEKQILMKTFNLNPKKLQYLLRKMREKQRRSSASGDSQKSPFSKKTITKETEKRAKEVILSNSREGEARHGSLLAGTLGSDTISLLQKELSLSKSQIYYLLRKWKHQEQYGITENQRITESQKECIRSYLNERDLLRQLQEASNKTLQSFQSHDENSFPDASSFSALHVHGLFPSIQQHLKQTIITQKHIDDIQKATRLNEYQIHHYLERLLAQRVRADQRMFIRNWIEKQKASGERSVTLTKDNLDFLRRSTQLSRRQVRNLVQYYLSASKKRKRITRHERERIRKFIETNPDSNIGRDQILELSSMTGLSVFQLRSLIQYVRDKNGTLSKFKRKEVQHWVDTFILKQDMQHNVNWPTFSKRLSSQDWDRLKQQFALSKRQLKGIIQRHLHHLTSPDAMLDGKTKQYVSMLLRQSSTDELTDQQKEEIEESENITRQQLNTLIWRIKQQNKSAKQSLRSNRSAQALVQEYLETKRREQGSQRKLSTEEMDQLQKRTNLSRQQLHYLVRRKYYHPPGNITDEKRFKVFQYLESRGFEKPSMHEMQEHFCEALELSVEQLRSLTRYQLTNYAPIIQRYGTTRIANMLHAKQTSHTGGAESEHTTLQSSNSVALKRSQMKFLKKYFDWR